MILATFVFADGSERTADVDEPPRSELVMEQIPAIPSFREWGQAEAPRTRHMFALEEGGPPYRYREVVLPASSAGVPS